jgi:glucose-1-phosphate adenylyltransferase
MRNDIQDVLILSGDHVYKMNYLQFLAFHKTKQARLSISAIRQEKDQAAGKLGIVEIDQDNRLTGFEEKPVNPKVMPDVPNYALASMGIYLFKIDYLIQCLQGQEEDFGKQIIPQMIGRHEGVYVYDYEKENRVEDFIVEVKDGIRKKVLINKTSDSIYWRDVGTIDSYYEASMDLIGINPNFNLYGEKWPIRTFQRPLPPSKCILNGRTPDSIISDGCIISGGTVSSSILSPGVIVEKDALVEQSILFDDVIVEPNAKIRRAIIDKGNEIETGASIGYDHNVDVRRGCIISNNGVVVVPKGIHIERDGLPFN